MGNKCNSPNFSSAAIASSKASTRYAQSWLNFKLFDNGDNTTVLLDLEKHVRDRHVAHVRNLVPPILNEIWQHLELLCTIIVGNYCPNL